MKAPTPIPLNPFTDATLRLRMARAEYAHARVALRITVWHRRAVPCPLTTGPSIGSALNNVKRARRALLDAMLDCEDAIALYARTDTAAMCAHSRTLDAAAYGTIR